MIYNSPLSYIPRETSCKTPGFNLMHDKRTCYLPIGDLTNQPE